MPSAYAEAKLAAGECAVGSGRSPSDHPPALWELHVLQPRTPEQRDGGI